MAFRDQIRKYKSGTGMAQSSSEELQSLSNQAERSIAPQTPLESSVIGSSADVAKMAGTPAQKTSSLRVALQQSKNLGDVQRTAQTRQTATADESASLNKEQSAQKLSGLNNRVQALTGQLLQQAQGSTNVQMTVKPESLNAFPPESQAEANELLTKLGTNTATNQDILRLNQLLGKTSQADMLNADQIKANFMAAADVASQALAQATPDQVKVTDIDPTTLGFTDMQELASTLGVPVEELGELSLEDLQKQAQEMFTEEFTKVAQLETRANDLNLGPAERAEARKSLREAGAVGVREAETEIDKLADQIVNADEIEFNNQTMSIKDMLSDEFVSGLVARYINADETDPFRDDLKANEPELAEWIEQNKAALDLAAKNVDEDVQRFAEVQQKNNALKNVAGGEPLSESIMKAIIPDFGQLRADEYNMSEMPSFLQVLHDPAADAKAQINLRSTLDEFNNTSPGLIPELATLSKEDLTNFGLTVAPDPSDPRYQRLLDYKQYLGDYKNIQAMDNSPDSIAKAVLGRPGSWDEMEQMVREARMREIYGSFGNNPLNPLVSTLDSNKDGNLDNPAQIAAKLKNGFAPGGQPFGIKSAMSGMPTSTSKTSAAAAQYNQTINPLYDKVKKYLLNPRSPTSISNSEMKELTKGLNAAEMQELYNTGLMQDERAVKALVDAYRPNFKPKELTSGRFDKLVNESAKIVAKAAGAYKNMRTDQADIYEEVINSYWDQDLYNEMKAMEKTMQKRYDAAKGLDKILWKEMWDEIRVQKNDYYTIKNPNVPTVKAAKTQKSNEKVYADKAVL